MKIFKTVTIFPKLYTMKYALFSFFLFIVVFAKSQEIKDLPLEIREVTTNITNTSTSETKTSFTYQYRYVGDEKWLSCGKKFEQLEPMLSRFESSRFFYDESIKARKLSTIILVGALAATTACIVTAQLEKKRWAIIVGTGAVGLTGLIIGLSKYYRVTDNILWGVAEYNRQIQALTGE